MSLLQQPVRAAGRGLDRRALSPRGDGLHMFTYNITRTEPNKSLYTEKSHKKVIQLT